jgi:hypothetical protein
MSVCSILFVDLLLFLSGVFGGLCDVNLCTVLLLPFMAIWVPISATLFRRAVLTLWHTFVFLGLRFFSSSLLFAWWPPLFFHVRNIYIKTVDNLTLSSGNRVLVPLPDGQY